MKLRRGGHDPRKVYNAYKSAVETVGQPTVILAHTIKGYGLGEAGEGRNISHQQKKLNEAEMLHFRTRFEIPIPEEAVHNTSFCRPPADSPEIGYMHERRRQLGGYMPFRTPDVYKRQSSSTSMAPSHTGHVTMNHSSRSITVIRYPAVLATPLCAALTCRPVSPNGVAW